MINAIEAKKLTDDRIQSNISNEKEALGNIILEAITDESYETDFIYIRYDENMKWLQNLRYTLTRNPDGSSLYSISWEEP